MSNPFFSNWFVDAAAEHLLDSQDVVSWVAVGDSGAVPAVRRGSFGKIKWPALHSLPIVYSFSGESITHTPSSDCPALDLVLRDVPADSAVHDYLVDCRGAVKMATRKRASLSSGPSYDDFLSNSLTSKKRKEYRRLARRLEEEGEVFEEWLPEGEEPSAWIDDFISLEDKGWKGNRGTAFARLPKATAFLHQIAKTAQTHGQLLIYRKRIESKPIAMLLCFLSEDTVYAFKIAHDPAYARYSPGVHAMLALSQKVLDGKLAKIADSCASQDHPMIDSLWPERRNFNDWYIPRTIVGRLFWSPIIRSWSLYKSLVRSA